MKYFLILIEYKTAIENIERITDQHRSHLKKGYEVGMFLISGPQVPRKGGVVIGKAENLDEIKSFFCNDPYYLNDYADYKFLEFNPKSFHPALEDWLSIKTS